MTFRSRARERVARYRIITPGASLGLLVAFMAIATAFALGGIKVYEWNQALSESGRQQKRQDTELCAQIVNNTGAIEEIIVVIHEGDAAFQAKDPAALARRKAAERKLDEYLQAISDNARVACRRVK